TLYVFARPAAMAFALHTNSGRRITQPQIGAGNYSFHIGFIAAAFLMIIEAYTLYVFARPAAMAFALHTNSGRRITQPQIGAGN
ncbi:hypothetical protein BUE68_12725, partial [Corynebacterium diphtheriae]